MGGCYHGHPAFIPPSSTPRVPERSQEMADIQVGHGAPREPPRTRPQRPSRANSRWIQLPPPTTSPATVHASAPTPIGRMLGGLHRLVCGQPYAHRGDGTRGHQDGQQRDSRRPSLPCHASSTEAAPVGVVAKTVRVSTACKMCVVAMAGSVRACRAGSVNGPRQSAHCGNQGHPRLISSPPAPTATLVASSLASSKAPFNQKATVQHPSSAKIANAVPFTLSGSDGLCRAY